MKMDLNDLRNSQTPPENDGQSEEIIKAPAEQPEALDMNVPDTAESPDTEIPGQISPADPSPAVPAAPTPETMPMPDPSAYGWQTAQNASRPAAPAYPAQNIPYAPSARQPYPQAGYRTQMPQQPYASAQPPYQGAQPYGYPPQNVPVYYGQYYAGRPPVAPVQRSVPSRPKEKMRAGTKAVFAVILALIVASTGFFAGYAIRDSRSRSSGGFVPDIPGWDVPIPGGPSESTPEESQPESSEPDDSQDEPSKPEKDYIVIPNTDGIQLEPLPEGEDRTAKDIYAEIKNSLVGVVVEEGTANESQGSGIVATEDGYLITNAHVVLNRRSVDVKIVTNDESSYEAVVVGFDKTTDLAVLKIVGTADTFTPAVFGDSDSLSVGDWVLAIGNPGGQDFASSLTRGIVSAVNRKVGSNSSSGMTYIQTDAAINPGNSGGALVNMAGQVVGINSSKIVASGYEGMGFAIPITKAKAIIDDLMANGYVVGRARLGIRGRNITAYSATLNGLPQGFEIMEFPDDSPFLSVDAKIGDIITAIDGEKVTSLTDISNILVRHNPGDTVEISLYRYEGLSEPETITVKIVLLEDKGETQE